MVYLELQDSYQQIHAHPQKQLLHKYVQIQKLNGLF